MCTAATYKTNDFYFGRTLDYESSYGEEIVIMPRNFPLNFVNMGRIATHYAVIGTAHVAQDYPLFYDAANEKGLAMAGLNFVGNAFYRDDIDGRDNVAQFEFIPWILCQCANVTEARTLIEKINITKTQFSPQMPSGQLHWIIADKNDCIVVESVKEGIKVYNDPVGVLTNNPPLICRCSGSTISVDFPLNSLKTHSLTSLTLLPTAVAWVQWVCQVTYPRSQDL